MTVTAKIILDSVSEEGIRLTTFQLRYPRFIHAELMTHRVFSRNASSSRAIPVKKIIQDILEDTAMPMYWGKNQPGMQAFEETDEPVFFRDMSGGYALSREQAWLRARDHAIEVARAFDGSGYHKQIVNRLLEPFAHITVVVTSTNYSNWFALRSHEDAQPEIKILSDAMLDEYRKSTPLLLKEGDWHLPYITHEDRVAAAALDFEVVNKDVANGIDRLFANNHYVLTDYPLNVLMGVSVARCARTSYKLHDGSPTTIEKDFDLFEKLLGSVPLHASPAEHQATPDYLYSGPQWKYPYYHGNFEGWVQFRKTLDGEFQ